MHDAGLPQGALASLGEAGARPAEAARAPRVRIQRRPVHGVLLLDKPLGLSSNDALQKAKWLLRAEKAGHTGTLDPLATGVLPLCFGAATKFSQIQLEAPKRYTAVARLGVTTSTGDAEGAVLERRAVDLGVVTALLPAVRERFLGLIQQVPPMHSALKKDGKALYEYARAGIEVEREPRTVHIHALDLRLEVLEDRTAQLHIDVACSKGTYIRTLGEDLGAALGCGAHLTLLRRTETGGIGLGGCVSLAALESMNEAERWACLQPVECLLGAYPSITLDEASAGRFLSGVRRRGAWADAPAVAVFGARPRALLGVGHVTAGELIPDRLLSPLEIQQILEGPPRLNASGTLETL